MQLIPDLALPMYWAPPNGSSIDSLKTLLDNKLRGLFDDRRDLLFDIRRGFTRGIFYNQDGIKIDDSLVEDIPTFDALPAHHNLDPIARLMEKWGKQWEQKAWQVTRPDIPAPTSIREMLPYPDRVYEVTRKGVSYKVKKTAILLPSFSPSPLQIRACDPASLVCDVENEGLHSIYPRLTCAPPEILMPEVYPLMGQVFDGDWEIQPREEIIWPEHTSSIRQRGQYIRVFTAGNERCQPIRVLPTGDTDFDLLAAFGNRFPEEFNRWRVPRHKTEMAREQQAANPWNMEEHGFLDKPFIAAGTLNTIPSTRINPGFELNLKRCNLCQWVTGRVIKASPCNHIICSTCLGVTILLSVNRYVCPFCVSIF